MIDDKTDQTLLDACLDAARAQPCAPSEALMTALLADAKAALPPRTAPLTPAAVRPRGGWRALVEALGGWPAMTGLAAAAATGLWIGIVAPEALLGVAGLDLAGDANAAWFDTSAELALGLGKGAFDGQ